MKTTTTSRYEIQAQGLKFRQQWTPTARTNDLAAAYAAARKATIKTGQAARILDRATGERVW